MAKAKSKTRWTAKGQRYDKPTQAVIEKKYREGPGWRNGAKVYKK